MGLALTSGCSVDVDTHLPPNLPPLSVCPSPDSSPCATVSIFSTFTPLAPSCSGSNGSELS